MNEKNERVQVLYEIREDLYKEMKRIRERIKKVEQEISEINPPAILPPIITLPEEEEEEG